MGLEIGYIIKLFNPLKYIGAGSANMWVLHIHVRTYYSLETLLTALIRRHFPASNKKSTSGAIDRRTDGLT